MDASERTPGGETSPAQPRTERDLRLLNAQLLEQAERLRELNREMAEGEQRLRLAIETGRIGLWVWNSTDVANSGDWSHRLKEIFGLPLDAEVTHDMFLKAVHPDDRERVDRAVMDALAGVNGGTYTAEYRSVHPRDGSLHWVTARGQAFFNARGEAVRFIGTVMDITDRKRVEEFTSGLNRELERRIAERTAALEQANRSLLSEVEERKRAEEALRLSEANFRRAIDAIPALVWSAWPDGHVDYLNQRWLEYTGLAPEEAAGQGWRRAIHPDDLAGLDRYWATILALQEPGEYEARLRRFDGAYRWFLLRATPLRDAPGSPAKWYGTHTDIEDRRASEHLARGQLEALKEILAGLARESEPEKFLEQILKTIGRQLHAHSLSVWQLHKNRGRVELAALYESGRFRLAGPEETREPSVLAPPMEHPVWTRFFATGEHCVLGHWDKDRVRVRLVEGADTAWHDWENDPVNHPQTSRIIQRLTGQNVVASLCVPMLVGGAVAGMISIRFQQKRTFACQEIDLARALAHQAMLALQLMRLSRQSREAAVMAERNRFARDIHDTLAQGLTGIIVQLEAAEDARSKGLHEEADRHLDHAGQLARESLHEARASVHALRPRALTQQQLCSVLADLVRKTTQGTSLAGQFDIEGEPQRLPGGWEENLLHMVQEGLANTLKHAQATQFRVRLAFSVREIGLEMTDNGRGFDPSLPGEGLGLRSLRERTEAMNGRLALESRPGRGTRVHVVLPTVTPP